MTRPESWSANSLPSGVKPVAVELTDVPALATTFKEHEIEVVISTVAHRGLLHQKLLGDAAEQAGVKLFVASEFGVSTIGQKEGAFGEYLKEIGMPFVRIFVSCIFLCGI